MLFAAWCLVRCSLFVLCGVVFDGCCLPCVVRRVLFVVVCWCLMFVVCCCVLLAVR